MNREKLITDKENRMNKATVNLSQLTSTDLMMTFSKKLLSTITNVMLLPVISMLTYNYAAEKQQIVIYQSINLISVQYYKHYIYSSYGCMYSSNNLHCSN